MVTNPLLFIFSDASTFAPGMVPTRRIRATGLSEFVVGQYKLFKYYKSMHRDTWMHRICLKKRWLTYFKYACDEDSNNRVESLLDGKLAINQFFVFLQYNYLCGVSGIGKKILTEIQASPHFIFGQFLAAHMQLGQRR